MANEYRGEVNVPGIGPLRYDWDGVARLTSEIGEDFETEISKAAGVSLNMNIIAKAVAIGSGLTVDEVKAASPPIVPTVQAVMAALNLAFHGKEGAVPTTGNENPPTPGKTSSRKRAGSRSGRG